MTSHFEDALARDGIDVVCSFSLPAVVRAEPALGVLATLAGGAATAILVGNTRALWQPFLAWLDEDPRWQDRANPLEDYVEETLTRAVEQHLPGARLLWTHETQAYLVPVQKLCHHAGLAPLSTGRFNIHPVYGPWFALRALVVPPTDPDWSVVAAPPMRPLDPVVEEAVAEQLAALTQQTAARVERGDIEARWEDWLALRDRYRVGRGHRYSDAQIHYHYTRDKQVLVDALARRPG